MTFIIFKEKKKLKQEDIYHTTLILFLLHVVISQMEAMRVGNY